MSAAPRVSLVVPTIGRPSLTRLLSSLADCEGPLPEAVLVVDDRRDQTEPLIAEAPERLRPILTVVPGAARGPAAARNRGWRAAKTEWVAFLDDDVDVPRRWLADLSLDLDTGDDVAAVQGQIRVPLPEDRPPTDWERDVAGLERAQWATADMAYRRAALAAVGGFDERFGRAYREDADLGLRVSERIGRVVRGQRHIIHPVGPPDPLVSVRRQAGNADDALMRELHGRDWRERAGAPRGRRARHLAVTAAGLLGVLALPSRRTRWIAQVGLLAWVTGTAGFARERIAPGPRGSREIATMIATSAVIPAAASWHWVRGLRRARRIVADRRRKGGKPAAVLLDRDGTLVVDRPYNGDPEKVELMPGAREAIDRLRDEGVPTAVVSNQSGVGRGLLTVADVDAVNQRVEELLGPLGPWAICTHEPGEGCGCRKPAGGLIEEAAARLGVDPADCVVIGDIGADAEAAHAAGARAVLVPTPQTRADERHLADAVARDLPDAVDRALEGWSV